LDPNRAPAAVNLIVNHPPPPHLLLDHAKNDCHTPAPQSYLPAPGGSQPIVMYHEKIKLDKNNNNNQQLQLEAPPDIDSAHGRGAGAGGDVRPPNNKRQQNPTRPALPLASGPRPSRLQQVSVSIPPPDAPLQQQQQQQDEENDEKEEDVFKQPTQTQLTTTITAGRHHTAPNSLVIGESLPLQLDGVTEEDQYEYEGDEYDEGEPYKCIPPTQYEMDPPPPLRSNTREPPLVVVAPEGVNVPSNTVRSRSRLPETPAFGLGGGIPLTSLEDDSILKALLHQPGGGGGGGEGLELMDDDDDDIRITESYCREKFGDATPLLTASQEKKYLEEDEDSPVLVAAATVNKDFSKGNTTASNAAATGVKGRQKLMLAKANVDGTVNTARRSVGGGVRMVTDIKRQKNLLALRQGGDVDIAATANNNIDSSRGVPSLPPKSTLRKELLTASVGGGGGGHLTTMKATTTTSKWQPTWSTTVSKRQRLGTGPCFGLQLCLPQPIIASTSSPCGRFAALLLGSHADLATPCHVLVITLPDYTDTTRNNGLRNLGNPTDNNKNIYKTQQQIAKVDELRVVGSYAVQPATPHLVSMNNDGNDALRLTPNSLQVAVTAKGWPVLVLSASLQLCPDEGNGHGGGGDGGGAIEGAVTVIHCNSSSSSSVFIPPLFIESRQGSVLTCVVVVPSTISTKEKKTTSSSRLLLAGEGGGVEEVQFDGLWRSFTWTRNLPLALYHRYELIDIARLLVPSTIGTFSGSSTSSSSSSSQLLLGLSSDGIVAAWEYTDTGSIKGLGTFSHSDYAVEEMSMIPTSDGGGNNSMAAADVFKKMSSAGGGGATTTTTTSASSLFLGLFLTKLRNKVSGQCNAAIVALTGASGLIILDETSLPNKHGDPTTACSTVGQSIAVTGTAEGRVHAWDVRVGGPVASLGVVGDDGGGGDGGRGVITSITSLPGKNNPTVMVTTSGGVCLTIDTDKMVL